MTEAHLHNGTFLIGCTFLALLLPLLSFVLSFLTSERYSWLVSLSAPLLMLFSTICALAVAITFWNEGPFVLKIDWFSMNGYSITADISLSNSSIIMLALVSIISFLVHLYSIGYMAGDRDIKKYFAMLGFFTFSMQGIVLSDNLLVLFIFWELVGFSSYMLIGHWTEIPQAGQAAKKAFIFNRTGDAGFLVGLMIIWAHGGTFNLSDIIEFSHLYKWQTAASLCIFCGVIGKSAQFPLFTWLPDAMEGPTPVSALIHAATMVAAGVYLLVRIFPIFTEQSLMVVAVTGMVTSIIGALGALSHYDIKKILAYSTISQLGLMILAIGAGAVQASLLHLFTHAFYKACLFLAAGSIIHSLHIAQHQSGLQFDVQDIRNLGGLRPRLPITFMAFLVSGASLAGIPFFSGFLSKEAVLASLWQTDTTISWLLLITFCAVSFLTVLYTVRLIWFVFMGVEKETKPLSIIEAPAVMRAPIIVLAFCSIWFMVSINPFNFTGWLVQENNNPSMGWVTVFSILWVSLALTTGYFIFRSGRLSTHKFFQNNFYLDILYQKTVGKLVQVSAVIAAEIDQHWIDKIIHRSAYVQVTLAHITGWFDRVAIDGVVNGLGRAAGFVGSLTRSFQNGKIQLYIFWSLFAIIIFLIWTIK